MIAPDDNGVAITDIVQTKRDLLNHSNRVVKKDEATVPHPITKH